MKKAFKWLDDEGVEYNFHDYKKSGVDEGVLKQALKEHGWESVINKRGTTWRELPPTIQNGMDNSKAIDVANNNPSILKRPLLLHKGKTYLGFKAEEYAEIFG